jgi:hypothetical protein
MLVWRAAVAFFAGRRPALESVDHRVMPLVRRRCLRQVQEQGVLLERVEG